MLYLSLLLHIYQPPTQDLSLTKKITNDSYRLILKILDQTGAKINLNIPASLTQQLIENGDDDIIRQISTLYTKGQIEFTGTAAYHPILPKLPDEQVVRQILLNDAINTKYFGEKIYCHNGFFPPEMAYSSNLVKVLTGLNYQWTILDGSAFSYDGKKPDQQVIYIKKDNNISLDNKNSLEKELKIFFRNNGLSTSIALSEMTTYAGFTGFLNSIENGKDEYLVIALDGETFGHHQPGQDKLLFDILSNNKDQFVTISELGKYFRTKTICDPLQSSWGVNVSDLRKKIYYPRWDYPGNDIHNLQWQLLDLALNKSQKTNDYRLATTLDRALHSDQFWWASKAPFWHPGMVEKGARMLLDAIYENTANNDIVRKEAERIYNDIVEKIKS